MEDQGKLVVFERKEVVLIFVFVILIAIIAFTLGVRTGKNMLFEGDPNALCLNTEDRKEIDLKSDVEEKVDDISGNSTSGFQDSMEQGKQQIDQKEVEDKLRAEMEKLAKQDVPVEKVEEQDPTQDEVETETITETVATNPYSGKYTIQIFSHQSLEVAQDFADSFTAKGYDVLINEVMIPGKGVWNRVSIGAFENYSEAQKYLAKEQKLFQENEYQIIKIK